jgi:hypothetical protein
MASRAASWMAARPCTLYRRACCQKWQRTKLFQACELKPIAIQWVRPSTVDGMNLD